MINIRPSCRSVSGNKKIDQTRKVIIYQYPDELVINIDGCPGDLDHGKDMLYSGSDITDGSWQYARASREHIAHQGGLLQPVRTYLGVSRGVYRRI